MLLGCSSPGGQGAASDAGAIEGGDAQAIGTGDPFDVPIDGVSQQQLVEFNDGDGLFDLLNLTAIPV
jgi:hypothetical protein